MARAITISKVEVSNIHIEKNSTGYACKVLYNLQNSDGTVSLQSESMKFTSGVFEEDPKFPDITPQLSVGSDVLVMNFVNAITTLMGDREEL